MIKPLPSRQELHSLFLYDEQTGLLFWRERGDAWFDRKFAGKRAGRKTAFGHEIVRFGGEGFLSHRIIWKMAKGEDPEFIDHVNGIRDDNRLSNLRSVTRIENNRNKAVQHNNSSGIPGVRFRSDRGRWCAEIKRDGKIVSLGSFDNFDDARSARLKAQEEVGYHANHGRVV